MQPGRSMQPTHQWHNVVREWKKLKVKEQIDRTNELVRPIGPASDNADCKTSCPSVLLSHARHMATLWADRRGCRPRLRGRLQPHLFEVEHRLVPVECLRLQRPKRSCSSLAGCMHPCTPNGGTKRHSSLTSLSHKARDPRHGMHTAWHCSCSLTSHIRSTPPPARFSTVGNVDGVACDACG